MLLIILLAMASCASSESRELDLLGKWDVTDFVANMPGVDHLTLAGGKKIAIETDYTFSKDGTMTTHLKSEGVDIEGTWEYDKASKMLTIKDQFGPGGETTESKYSIKESSENEIEWHQDMGDFGNTITYLKKY